LSIFYLSLAEAIIPLSDIGWTQPDRTEAMKNDNFSMLIAQGVGRFSPWQR
jgi:hypothetical protein